MDTAIGYLAYFVAVELLPFLIIESFKEVENVDGVNEVDESVAHVAPVLEVNRQVEEVVLVLCVSVNCLQQHFLGVLVRDVSDHYRSTHIRPSCDVVKIQVEVRLKGLYRIRVPLYLRLILVKNVLLLKLRLAEGTLLILIRIPFASKDACRVYRLLKWLVHLRRFLLVCFVGFANLELGV